MTSGAMSVCAIAAAAPDVAPFLTVLSDSASRAISDKRVRVLERVSGIVEMSLLVARGFWLLAAKRHACYVC